jgi:hypothetical protein
LSRRESSFTVEEKRVLVLGKREATIVGVEDNLMEMENAWRSRSNIYKTS